MKLKKFIPVPIILLVISIITSIIAFQQDKLLEHGYLYVDGQDKSTFYGADYIAILGNIEIEAYYISVESLDQYLYIVTYDNEENILKEFALIIRKKDEIYSPTIVKETISSEMVVIDDMDDYLFTVTLDENSTYAISLNRLDENLDTTNINVALVYIPEDVYNLKSIMENVAFTTLVFALVSAITIVAVYFVKRN
jgi:hypothetical protein